MENRTVAVRGAVAMAVLSFVAGVYSVGQIGGWLRSGVDAASIANAQGSDRAAIITAAAPVGTPTMELNEKQMASVKVVNVGEYAFPVEKSAVGSIDFNEEMTVQVFTPYQGKILQTFAKVGDEVKRGQTLFTIDSPDLLAANSNLIAAAGVLELLDRNLARLKKLYETRAVSQHDLEQAISDQQTAEVIWRPSIDAPHFPPRGWTERLPVAEHRQVATDAPVRSADNVRC